MSIYDFVHVSHNYTAIILSVSSSKPSFNQNPCTKPIPLPLPLPTSAPAAAPGYGGAYAGYAPAAAAHDSWGGYQAAAAARERARYAPYPAYGPAPPAYRREPYYEAAPRRDPYYDVGVSLGQGGEGRSIGGVGWMDFGMLGMFLTVLKFIESVLADMVPMGFF